MTIDITGAQAYSSTACRSFKTFIGELTAVAAGVYVGIQEVLPLVQELDPKDPWKVAAKKHGVIVDGLKSEQVVLVGAEPILSHGGADRILDSLKG